ncbi:MAG: hypothetical protein ACREEM_10520 [Blastocatellia bacterium]
MKVLAILNLPGAAQGILLAIVLLSIKRGNRLANQLLAAFVATTAFQILGAILFTTKYINDFPQLSRLHHPFRPSGCAPVGRRDRNDRRVRAGKEGGKENVYDACA